MKNVSFILQKKTIQMLLATPIESRELSWGWGLGAGFTEHGREELFRGYRNGLKLDGG